MDKILWDPLLAQEATEGTETTIQMSFRPAELASSARMPWNVGTANPGIDEDENKLKGLEEIGQGGMGIVYRSIQSSLNRSVAIKTLKGGATSSSTSLFISEAQVTGRLEHANIVPIHALEKHSDGQPYLTMKLLDGRDWRAVIREPADLVLKDQLRILLTVCQAMAFAHEQGVIHRDLKPENIMVCEFGQVYVMDWGLAASIDRGRHEGSAILHASELKHPAGTPVHMAPELAEGRGEDQDERTDVYLLGACLHEVLTGRPRHAGGCLQTVLERAVESTPYDYEPSVPREIAEICNRAMACEPEHRYQSVEDLRAAVEGFLEHEQANVLTSKAIVLLGRLQDDVAAFDPVQEGRKARVRSIHQLFTKIQFALEHALESWPESIDAREALLKLGQTMIEHALITGDLGLAERLLPGCETPELVQRVEALRTQLRSREVELTKLRDQARRLDWSAVASPLGTIFIIAGLLIGSGFFIADAVHRSPGLEHRVLMLVLMWSAVLIAIGAVAWYKFRHTRVPDSLVSARMLGTWAAVALGCLLHGSLAGFAGSSPSLMISPASIMFGIGLSAMAFQTRRWLLVPALLFYGAAVLTRVIPDYASHVFGALWILVACGLGIAFKMGVTLGDDTRE